MLEFLVIVVSSILQDRVFFIASIWELTFGALRGVSLLSPKGLTGSSFLELCTLFQYLFLLGLIVLIFFVSIFSQIKFCPFFNKNIYPEN